MLIFLFRGLAARGVLLAIARGLGSAAASGVGWKLGSDAYDAIKRWCAEVDEVDPD